MTRENKYRGQRLDNREWVYGSLMFAPGRNGNSDYAVIRVFTYHNDEGKEWVSWEDYEVDVATVGQYTTFKDKNGIEVYESHILIDKFGGIGVVEWQNGAFVVNFGDVDIFSIEDCFDESLQMWTIGNIHDNPELLKGGVQ